VTRAGKKDAPRDHDYGRRLFRRPVEFLLGAASVEGIPYTKLPEIAFAGRSNVGKSSLINALVDNRTLARASNTPGRTQELNFFNLDSRLMMVDLPGYGFAKAPQDKAAAWGELVRLYLKGRPTLRRALVLVDSRHGLKDVDRSIMKMMDEAAVNYQIILTKCDKITPPEIEKMRETTAETAGKHVAAHPEILFTSAETGAGIDELRTVLSELALPE
jgi:GTP-binding protein